PPSAPCESEVPSRDRADHGSSAPRSALVKRGPAARGAWVLSGTLAMGAIVAVGAGTAACGGAGAGGAQGQAPLAGPSGPAGGANLPAGGAAETKNAGATAAAGSDLTDGAKVAFRADFSPGDFGSYGGAWNLFGAAPGLREVTGGPDGLSLRVIRADK